MIVSRDITSNIISKQGIIGGLSRFALVLLSSDPNLKLVSTPVLVLALYCLVMRLPFIKFPELLISHLVLSWRHRTVC